MNKQWGLKVKVAFVVLYVAGLVTCIVSYPHVTQTMQNVVVLNR